MRRPKDQFRSTDNSIEWQDLASVRIIGMVAIVSQDKSESRRYPAAWNEVFRVLGDIVLDQRAVVAQHQTRSNAHGHRFQIPRHGGELAGREQMVSHPDRIAGETQGGRICSCDPRNTLRATENGSNLGVPEGFRTDLDFPGANLHGIPGKGNQTFDHFGVCRLGATNHSENHRVPAFGWGPPVTQFVDQNAVAFRNVGRIDASD